MRFLPLLGVGLSLLVAGCSGESASVNVHSCKGGSCASAALREAQARTHRDGLGGVVAPLAKDAYRDLRQETFSQAGWDDQAELSPDGKWLAFASTDCSPAADIFIKPSDGPRLLQKTTHPAEDQFPRFSHDGRRIAFASNRNGSWDIFVMDTTQNGAIRQITNGLGDHIAPSWSRDDKCIAYSASAGGGDWEIWIVNLESSQLTRLGPGLFPRWSPKDDRIVFQRARYAAGNWYGVYTVDRSGNDFTELVAPSGWGAVDPCWDPTGEWIAFAGVGCSMPAPAQGGVGQGDDIWIVRADGTARWRVTDEDGPEWNPCWGSNGRIYFTATREGRTNLWSITPQLPFEPPPPTQGQPIPPAK